MWLSKESFSDMTEELCWAVRNKLKPRSHQPVIDLF